MTSFNLEQSARELIESIAKGPPLSSVSLAEARKAAEAAQSAPLSMPDVDESWATLSSVFGDFEVRIVRPVESTGPLPTILYMHGGGWILGSWITHDLLTRRLAIGANAAVVFVEYSRAPEAKYPVQIEQCYAAAQWIMEQGAAGGFDITRIAVAGDSAGGNMSAVLALMAKQRGSVQFVHQSLYYPMTDANAEDSESLRRFKDGPYGSAEGLAWFWNSYLSVDESRSDILVSPLQATLADLEGLPPALVIVDQNDLLRDQGEAYADKLRNAGVPTTSVRFDAPPNIGHNIRRAVDEITAANGLTNHITHMVYSHHHADHQGASSLFGGDIVRIGHEETRRLLLRDDDPARPVPDVTFSDSYTLEAGGERVELAWHGPNHSPDNIYIHFPDHDTLMFIDVVNAGWIPIYNLNLSDDVIGYTGAPAIALDYPWTHLISGHLGRVATREDVAMHQQYIADIDASSREALASVNPGPIFKHYGENVWAAVKAHLDAVTEHAAAPVIAKYTGVLGGADIEIFTRTTTFAIMQSIRLDRGPSGPVHP